METGACFFGKSSATHPSHTKTADVGFWLFPRAKVQKRHSIKAIKERLSSSEKATKKLAQILCEEL